MTPSDPRDRDLVHRCLAGEPGGWERLFGQFDPVLRARLKSIAARRGIPLTPGDLDEILARVWEDLCRADMRLLRLWQAGASLERWLLMIAARRWLHHIWARGEEARLRETVPLDSTPPTLAETEPDAPALVRERQVALDAVLERLPPRERFAVRAFYWFGWPHHRIARLLGIPVHQVGPLLSAARARLRRIFRNPGAFPA